MNNLLDKWQKDILDQMTEMNTHKELSPTDTLVVNNALFMLIKSPVWIREFEGATLNVRNDGSGYSWIDLPKLDDPDSDATIRYGTKINCLEWKFSEPEDCFYDESYNHVLWETDEQATAEKMFSPVACAESKKLLSRLALNNPYYRQLINGQIEDSSIKIRVIENPSYWDILKTTNMHFQSGNPITNVFGHIYLTQCENRTLILAENSLGPIGVLGIFNYNNNKISHNPDRLSLSYVSVSPSYRSQGIAKKLLLECLTYAKSKGKFVTRTEPSETGKKFSFECFTRIAKELHPDLPFVARDQIKFVEALYKYEDFSSMPYKNKCTIIQNTLKESEKVFEEGRKLQEHMDYSYIDTTAVLAKIDKQINRLKVNLAKAPKTESLEI